MKIQKMPLQWIMTFCALTLFFAPKLGQHQTESPEFFRGLAGHSGISAIPAGPATQLSAARLGHFKLRNKAQ